MQHLYVLVAYQQFLAFCARDRIEERPLVFLVDAGGSGPIGLGDLERDLQIDHVHFSLLTGG